MIDDLRRLNLFIASHWLGQLDAEQRTYLDFTSVCVGQPALSAGEFAHLLARLKQDSWSAATVGELNRRYLTFARLAAQNEGIENIDMLVRLGITLGQAEFLRSMSDDDLERLAFGGAGPLMKFVTQAFRRGVRLHAQAGLHHASALVAAHVNSSATRRQ